MIREIIHLTNSLMNDKYTLSILQRKMKPSKGLHIFIEIDSDGKWKNQPPRHGIDYAFYGDKNEFTNFSSLCAQYEACGKRVGFGTNKVICKEKQILSCSPFILGFNQEKFLKNKPQRIDYEKFTSLLPSYFERARQICKVEDEKLIQLTKAFEQVCLEVLQRLNNFTIPQKDGSNTNVLAIKTSDRGCINLYLRDASLKKHKEAHDNYLREKLFNDNKYNTEKKITDETYGLSNFFNGLNGKKVFLAHRTAALHKGLNGRITSKDVFTLNDFEILLFNHVLPNPLPIVIDKDELNKEIVHLFNSENEPMPYRELLKNLFAKAHIEYLQDYYLLHYGNTKKGLIINDFDFVPLFRFNIESDNEIFNLTKAKPDSTFHTKLTTVFDFERVVVKEIFNNSLVKIDKSYSTNYFGNIEPKYVKGDDIMYQQIRKYRKAFYNYIYKSQRNAIDTYMFDDMMYHSILSNIRTDEIKGRFEWNNTIKKKLNIWFSLYTLFNNNLKGNDMASKVPDLMSKMNSVAKGETHFETPEEFAFGAGQLVSYLIDRSVAANKTYTMLEPYLQKNKSNQLQDAIAQTIGIYKHDINVYRGKGKFERLAAQVLTDNSDVEMKPLMKYFLAGCFCPCVIYESDKNKETNN